MQFLFFFNENMLRKPLGFRRIRENKTFFLFF